MAGEIRGANSNGRGADGWTVAWGRRPRINRKGTTSDGLLSNGGKCGESQFRLSAVEVPSLTHIPFVLFLLR